MRNRSDNREQRKSEPRKARFYIFRRIRYNVLLEIQVVQCIAEVLGLTVFCGFVVLVKILFRTRTTLATLGTGTAFRTGSTIATLRTRTTLATVTAGRTLLVALGFLNEYTV